MRFVPLRTACLLLAVAPAAAEPASPLANSGEGWAGFRGDGTSRSPAREVPAQWSDKKNIAWRASLAGYGQSSPVVWKGRVYTTSKEGEAGEALLVHCHDLGDGKLLWKYSHPASRAIKPSGYVSQAAPTPTVDADALYCFWETGDIVSLDHDGKLRWKRNLALVHGQFQGNHGVGTSLIQSSDSLCLLVDHAGPSYLLRIDKTTAKDTWKADRPQRVSWSTPTLAGGTLYISSNGVAEAYDFKTGKRLWQAADLQGNTVASPTLAGERVLVGSSVRGQSLGLSVADGSVLFRPGEETTSSFGSPLVAEGFAYYVNRAGIVFCHEAATGRKLWHQRIGGSCWASPVAAGARVYFFTKEGRATVLDGKGSETVVAENTLSLDGRLYGVAVVDGRILVRTGSELICIAELSP